MPSFYDDFGDPETIFELEPEELGAKILFFLRRSGSNFHNFASLEVPHNRQDLSPQKERIERYLREGWSWLEAQGLLIPELGTNGQNGYRFLGRKARLIENSQDFKELRNANLLPRDILHEKIRRRVWSAFIRGEYDSAVFCAMKAVEVYVREAAGYDQGQYGVPMMRNAFHKTNGPLTDPSLEEAERDAVGHLFAGVYGYFRNPTAHRDVPLDSPSEAMEIVLLANHLLRIVDAAVARRAEESEHP